MTKQFSKEQAVTSAKSDIWASFRLVSAYPEKEIKKILKKRSTLRDALAEQILMATNRSYAPMKSKWITEVDGNVRRVAVPVSIKKWWRHCPDGKVQIRVYHRGKMLELAPGKNAIEINSHAELLPTLNLINASIDLGDFDEFL